MESSETQRTFLGLIEPIFGPNKMKQYDEGERAFINRIGRMIR